MATEPEYPDTHVKIFLLCLLKVSVPFKKENNRRMTVQIRYDDCLYINLKICRDIARSWRKKRHI